MRDASVLVYNTPLNDPYRREDRGRKEMQVKIPDTEANSCHLVSTTSTLVFSLNKTTRK